jgi:hypothetical protein
VTSPEVLIFLFFMITDPKTTPTGQVGRVAFGVLVAIASTLLMAPQTDEFGTKVGLLAGLVLICAARPILDRLVPEPRSEADRVGAFTQRLVVGAGAGAGRTAAGLGVAAVAILVIGVGIVAAGTPARGLVIPPNAEALDGVPRVLDPSTFPAITIDQDVSDYDHTIEGPGAQQILMTLAQNLQVESEALLRSDPSLLAAVAHGDRLAEMEARLDEAKASGTTTVEHYDFDDVHVVLIVPFGVQTGSSLGFQSRGTVTTETYDAGGALLDRSEAPFDKTFALRQATGDRWLTVAVLPPDAGS